MKYVLLIHDDPNRTEDLTPEYMTFTQSILESGEMLGGDKLEGPETATSVRVRDGRTTTTDGPFVETKEVLGGYYIIEAASYDQAIERSRDCPHLEYGGTIEVRQVDMI